LKDLITVRSKSNETAAVLLLFLLAAGIFTWPLALHLAEAVPQGSEQKAVAYFQFFCMRWTAQTLSAPASYWHAPFFHPFPGAFAWCEPQLFNAVIVAALAQVFGYIVGYNLLILGSMALMGLAGYCAARLLTADRVAAFFTGLWLCAGAFSLQQICAPALLSAWSIVFFLVFLFLFARTALSRYFWLAGFCYLATWFTLKQSALVLTLFLPCAVWPWLKRPAQYRHLILGLCALMILAAAAVVAYAAQQWFFTQDMGFARELKDVFGLTLPGLFMPAKGHWLSSRILGLTRYSWDLGIVVCLILTAALAGGFARRNTLDVEQRKISAALLTLAFAGLFLAAAPHLKLHRLLFRFIPGFTFIRASDRSLVFTIFSLAVLSAPAFAWMRQRMKRSRRRAVTAAVFILLSAEMWTMPIPLVRPGEELKGHQAVVSWLKAHEPSAPIIELPLQAKSSNPEAAAMLRMLEHKHPLINGYAAFSPFPYRQLKQALLADPEGQGKRFLRAYGARFVLVHEHLLSAQESALLAAVLEGERVFHDPGHAIYRLPDPIYIGKETDFLPLKSSFGQKQPSAGKRYAMALKKPLAQARFVYLREKQVLMEWETAGSKQGKQLSLRGAVILDKGQEQLCFRMLKFPKDGQHAEGLVMPCK